MGGYGVVVSEGEEPGYVPLGEYLARHPEGAQEIHGYARLAESAQGDEGWLPEDDEGTRCYFCAARPAVWAHRLDETKLTRPGEGGFTLGGPLLTCHRCTEVFDDGDDEQLVTLGAAAFDAEYGRHEAWTDDEVDYEFRAPLRAFRSAVLDREALTPHVDRPEVAALHGAGFEPLEEYTGITDELGPLWPTQHSRCFPDRRRFAEPGELRWYVRSPWPSVALRDIFMILWPHVEFDKNLDHQVRAERIRAVFSWPEARAQEEARNTR